MASRNPSFNDDVAARAAESSVLPIQNRDGDAASLSVSDARTSDARDATTVRSAQKPLVIGIAGGSGSGKSTVARKVGEAISGSSVAFLDMDAYYRNFAHLPMEERKRVNWDHPDAFDMTLFAQQVEQLCAGGAIDKPTYDFVSHTRSTRTQRIEPADVLVLDGILLFVDETMRSLCDVKVFVDADADIRLIRRLRRDVQKRGRTLEDVIAQYLETVHPMHLQFVEPSKRYADVIVPRGGHNSIAIEMIVAKIQHRLRGRIA
ncbi:MAG TPA: uridine kinase [Gemmatimonadaceae bacterium]|nr:uridine kinase [Gemmatimonadaceae bacterium]